MATVAQGHPWRTAVAARSTVVSAALLLTFAAGCAAPDPVVLDSGELQAADDVLDLATKEATAADTATAEPLVTASPDAYSLVGDLVDGFPIDLLPVPNDAVILVTSAAPVGDAKVQQVSLNLRTSATPSELLELYREALTAAGFTEVPETSESDLAVDATFVRSGGDELVSIGVLDVNGARTVTIGGRVHTQD